MICMKILVLLLTYANTINGIQVYENVTDDITTSTTKLVLVPTPVTKNDASGNDKATETSLESKEQTNQTTANNSTVDVSQEKSARNNESGYSRAKAEHHENTSSNVKHEKFVPSPEISLSGIEIQQPSGAPQANDNFYPTSHYYHPVKHSVHFHSSLPITSTSNWKHSSGLDSLHKNYPKFEEEVSQHQQKEKETFTFATPSIDSSKWYFMPERPRLENTEKPLTRPAGKWKWVSDEEDEQDKRNAISQSSFQTIPPNDFSYTFEIPTTTDSTPFSFNKYEGIDTTLNGEVPSTSLGNSESEWESPFTSSNGKLKHKGKGRGASISPWKKILHVLTAAIPIGLLISALTPQVIYVDPNSTSSISPSTNSLGLLSTTSKQRSLDERVHPLADVNDLANGRKFVSNPLMDFLHVLRDNGNSMERSDSCDDRKFCEASRSGADSDANVLNKMLWKMANETPEFQARKSGLEHIFHAIRHNKCSIFECKQPDLNDHRQDYRKN